MSKLYVFAFSCVGSSAEKINEITDNSRKITRKTFLKHVDSFNFREKERDLGYESHPKKGLTMAADHHVTYHKSKYKNRIVYYFCWSGIEFVFLKG
jgi:hypothetical protein